MATLYPLLGIHLQEDLQTKLSLYATLGVFLLLASGKIHLRIAA